MRFILIFVILSMNGVINAQQKTNVASRFGTYIEAYGIRHDFSEGFISFNGEFYLDKKKRLLTRIGIYPDWETTVSFPLHFAWIAFSQRNSQLEYGLGTVFRLEFYEGNIYRDIPSFIIPVMYRYQSNSGFFLRTGLNLFISWPTIISPSVSLGWRF